MIFRENLFQYFKLALLWKQQRPYLIILRGGGQSYRARKQKNNYILIHFRESVLVFGEPVQKTDSVVLLRHGDVAYFKKKSPLSQIFCSLLMLCWK